MSKFNLTWGESVAVRQEFLKYIDGTVHFGNKELLEMDYTSFNGNEALLEHTRKIIKRQTGLDYKHVFLTNGASGGVTIALRAYASLGVSCLGTNPPPFFPLYPAMMRAAGIHDLTHDGKWTMNLDRVFLLDSPANPSGQFMGVPAWAGGDPVIWDAVYYNQAYCSVMLPPPNHDIMVGSYSKLTGINGLRLGWIATNNPCMAEVIGNLIAPEYCGLSKPSKMILKQLLDQYDDHCWLGFEIGARYKLDGNRQEWAKLERFFGGQGTPVNGMFFYGPMDSAAKKLFERAGVEYKLGSECGHVEDFGRFNIGQDPMTVSGAVKAVLKADKI